MKRKIRRVKPTDEDWQSLAQCPECLAMFSKEYRKKHMCDALMRILVEKRQKASQR